jgi:hypothetical protein
MGQAACNGPGFFFHKESFDFSEAVGSGGLLHRGVRGHSALWDLRTIFSSAAGGSKRAPEMSLKCYLSIAMTAVNQDWTNFFRSFNRRWHLGSLTYRIQLTF